MMLLSHVLFPPSSAAWPFPADAYYTACDLTHVAGMSGEESALVAMSLPYDDCMDEPESLPEAMVDDASGIYSVAGHVYNKTDVDKEDGKAVCTSNSTTSILDTLPTTSGNRNRSGRINVTRRHSRSGQMTRSRPGSVSQHERNTSGGSRDYEDESDKVGRWESTSDGLASATTGEALEQGDMNSGVESSYQSDVAPSNQAAREGKPVDTTGSLVDGSGSCQRENTSEGQDKSACAPKMMLKVRYESVHDLPLTEIHAPSRGEGPRIACRGGQANMDETSDKRVFHSSRGAGSITMRPNEMVHSISGPRSCLEASSQRQARVTQGFKRQRPTEGSIRDYSPSPIGIATGGVRVDASYNQQSTGDFYLSRSCDDVVLPETKTARKSHTSSPGGVPSFSGGDPFMIDGDGETRASHSIFSVSAESDAVYRTPYNSGCELARLGKLETVKTMNIGSKPERGNRRQGRGVVLSEEGENDPPVSVADVMKDGLLKEAFVARGRHKKGIVLVR